MGMTDLPRDAREMDQYTPQYLALFKELASQWNVHIIGCSHPAIPDGQLSNTAYFFTPAGEVFTQGQLYRTRSGPNGIETDHL